MFLQPGPSLRTISKIPLPVPEYFVMKDPSPVFFPFPETVMKHLVIDDVLHYVCRDEGPIQDRVDSYKIVFPGITSEPYRPSAGPTAAVPPGNPTIYPILEILTVQAFEDLLKMIMATLGHDVGFPGLRLSCGSSDFRLIDLYKGAEDSCNRGRIPP